MLADVWRVMNRADGGEAESLVETLGAGAGLKPKTHSTIGDDVFDRGVEEDASAPTAATGLDDGHAAQTPGVPAAPGIALARDVRHVLAGRGFVKDGGRTDDLIVCVNRGEVGRFRVTVEGVGGFAHRSAGAEDRCAQRPNDFGRDAANDDGC